jgi:hypothetical protein
VYLKGNSSGSVSLRAEGATSAPVNNVNYTTSYQQFTYTFTADSTTTNLVIGGFGSWRGSEAIYVAFPQANIGSTAKPYFPTTDRLNVPRLTYQNGGGGCPSLLLEKQSTNLLLYSEQFDNSAYNKISGGSATVPVVTANFATSPDGSQNADRIQFARTGTTASDFSAINQSSLTLSATGTTTIYLKSNTSSNQNVLMYWGGGQGQVFLVTPSWQRFTLSNLSVGTDAIVFGTRGGSGNFFNGGDLTLDILAWGAQVEASSYATSYIPTTSASATRVADVCSKTGISSLIGQTEGVLYTDFVCNGFQDFGTPLCVNDGSTSNSIWLTTFANGTLRGEVFGSGSVQASFSMSGGVVGQRYKMALAYKANDFAMYVNGVQIGTDLLGSIPSNLSRVDYDYANAAVYSLSLLQINESVLFKTRLTNAELASLTTI